MPRALEQLLSVPQVAKLASKSYRSMLRLLLKMYADDCAKCEPTDWLVRHNGTSKFRINMARLEVRHPALFIARYVDRDEFGEIILRVKACEESIDEECKQRRALGSRVRGLENRVALEEVGK